MTLSPARPVLRASLLLTAVAALALLGLVPGGPARAATPQLSIGVDDGQGQTRSGATLRYTVTVTNLGGQAVKDLHLTQTVPSGARLGAADHGGRQRSGTLHWTLDVPAGGSATVHSSLTVSDGLPEDLFRLASVACAATSAKAAPSVCASDSDQLPAGAAAEQQQARLQEPPPSTHPRWLLPSALGLGALLLVGTLGVALRRRGRQGLPLQPRPGG